MLRPDGLNPLKLLHSALSDGLHAQSDDECLELAADVKESLTFLIEHVTRSRQNAKTYAESMKELQKKAAHSGPEGLLRRQSGSDRSQSAFRSTMLLSLRLLIVLHVPNRSFVLNRISRSIKVRSLSYAPLTRGASQSTQPRQVGLGR